jgi:sodium/hydrogen antiporter
MSLESILLSQISYIAVILLIGLLVSILANRLNIPDILLLTLAGVAVGIFARLENIGLSLPNTFVAGLAIFTLVLIVFESTAEIRFKELDWVSGESLKITLTSVIFMVVLFSGVVWGLLFRFASTGFFPSLIFGTIMAGTAPDVIMTLLHNSKIKVLDVLRIESIINTPFVVLLPILVIQISRDITTGIVSDFFRQLMINVITGIGAGVVVGIIMFKAMRTTYSEIYSPIAVITASLISYILAENIGGNGILAVTTLGLFFANLDIKQKVSLLRFQSVLATLLRVLIFVLVGVIITLPSNVWFYINSAMLFVAYLAIRYLSLEFSAREFNVHQRLFMTLSAAKGLPVVVVTFTLAAVFGGLENVLDHVLIIVVYSLITASLVSKFGMGLIGEPPAPKSKSASKTGKK